MSTSRFRPTILSDMAFVSSGSVLVLAHKPGTPDFNNWNAFLTAAEAAATVGTKLWLIYAENTTPSASERASAASFHTTHGSRAAILTNASVTRGVVTAIGWLSGSHIKAFKTTDLGPAFEFLSVPNHDRDAAKRALAETTRALGVGTEYFNL